MGCIEEEEKEKEEEGKQPVLGSDLGKCGCVREGEERVDDVGKEIER